MVLSGTYIVHPCGFWISFSWHVCSQLQPSCRAAPRNGSPRSNEVFLCELEQFEASSLFWRSHAQPSCCGPASYLWFVSMNHSKTHIYIKRPDQLLLRRFNGSFSALILFLSEGRQNTWLPVNDEARGVCWKCVFWSTQRRPSLLLHKSCASLHTEEELLWKCFFWWWHCFVWASH